MTDRIADALFVNRDWLNRGPSEQGWLSQRGLRAGLEFAHATPDRLDRPDRETARDHVPVARARRRRAVRRGDDAGSWFCCYFARSAAIKSMSSRTSPSAFASSLSPLSKSAVSSRRRLRCARPGSSPAQAIA